METFSALLAFVWGIHRSPVNSPLKVQWLIYAWIHGWVNDPDDGNLRHHRVHYDLTVMRYYMGNHSISVYKQNYSVLFSSPFCIVMLTDLYDMSLTWCLRLLPSTIMQYLDLQGVVQFSHEFVWFWKISRLNEAPRYCWYESHILLQCIPRKHKPVRQLHYYMCSNN